MRAITIRTFLPGMICALCAASFTPSTAAEPDTDGRDVLSVVRSRDKNAIRSDTVSVPVPPAGTRVDSVLATVNGEPITMLDVILETGSREKELAGIYSGERLRSETLKLHMETVDQIVFRKLIYEKYKTEPFDIPRQEIENLLDEFVRTSGAESRAALEKSFLSAGITPERLREQAKERIAFEVLLMHDCDHHVNITPKEVYEDYKAHPEKWTVPEKISLQLLQINVTAGAAGGDPKAAVKAVRDELDKDSSQKNFTRLVLEKSDGATASTGGITEGAELDKLRPEFIAALKGKKAGDVVGPVEAPEAYFFLRVVGTEPSRLIPFSRANREVREALFKEKVAEKRKEYEAQIRRDAIIRRYFD
ncbi:MAG: peptidyl-prolyl cis-trans isomerase [Lentisphaeria bacterium]|nr:peptidyl-prolyl cis-trans isomerase [Lentisphaeria bacterium]